jgi:phosphatidylglycerol:prolipoprotein diacylglycerol transferase
LLNAFAIWNGGLGIIGGLIGGMLGLFIFARARRLPFKDMLGAVAVVIPVGQVIGRLGNLFNHELYGPPTDLPWGQFIPEQFRKSGFEASEYFHPLFLYEALANLVLFTILWNLWQRGWRGLKLVWVYLGGYGVIRFSLDFLRIDGNTGVGGLSYTQWLILAGFIVGGVVYLFRLLKKHG